MGKYYCDYCDTYLTHDSPSVRKTHNSGRRHKDNVRLYYVNWLENQAQTFRMGMIRPMGPGMGPGLLAPPGMIPMPPMPMPPGMMMPHPLGLPPPRPGMVPAMPPRLPGPPPVFPPPTQPPPSVIIPTS